MKIDCVHMRSLVDLNQNPRIEIDEMSHELSVVAKGFDTMTQLYVLCHSARSVERNLRYISVCSVSHELASALIKFRSAYLLPLLHAETNLQFKFMVHGLPDWPNR